MNEKLTLMEKRAETQQTILALRGKTPTALVLNFFSRWFPKSILEQSLFYWILQIVLLHAVIILPALLLALARGEIGKWSGPLLVWIIAIELNLFGFILAHVAYQLAFHELAMYTVHKITNFRDLFLLEAFCTLSKSSMYIFLIAGGVLWPVWNLAPHKEFLGIGFTYMNIITGCLVSMAIQAVFWTLALANQLKDFQYELNTFMPANSEIVVRLSSILNKISYLIGSFFVVLTFLVSSGIFGSQLNKALAFPIALFGWTIIIIQFLVNRSAINGIVEKERWTNLNKLQLQMNTVQATEDLSNKNVSERLLRLADLHERIRSNRSAGFDLKSVLNLFSQLMLPLLGLLLGNIDKLMDFLK